jgi:2-methylcitrate dehydratase PrpD
MKRVKYTLITEYDKAMPQYSPYDQVTVKLKGGKVLASERIVRAKGHITRPLSEAELFEKFASCLDFAASDLDRRGLFDSFNHLDRQPAGWLARAVAAKGRTSVAEATH